MSRGVAIPQAREQLFSAAERVLAREGPDGLTSRAITGEAGVAKGLLHNHFGDLDEFLAQLILDRARRTAGQAARLPSLAGTGTVAGNLADAAASVLQSGAFATASLVLLRPTLMARIQQLAAGAPTALDDIQQAFAAYLAAEQKLGRITAGADTQALALAITGTVHHTFLTTRSPARDGSEQVRRAVTALIAGATSDSPDSGDNPAGNPLR
jgi:AcrR family transcriptional regulator